MSRKARDVSALVDLSELGLAYIRDDLGDVVIGTMSSLSALAESPMLRAAANGVVAQGAHDSAASLLRNQATVGGTLIARPAGVLATVMAALDATVKLSTVSDESSSPLGLVEFLQRREHFLVGAVLTEVVIPRQVLTRHCAFESVARTPRDRPIVSVCVALDIQDRITRSASIALGELAETAVRATEAERVLVGAMLDQALIERAALEAMDPVSPTSDFRGTAEYRKAMVGVLTARALRSISQK